MGVPALVMVVLGVVTGLAPGAPGSPGGAQAATGGCGREWSSAKQIGTLPGELDEVSGFVSSSRYPGVAWMIRDSDRPHSLWSSTGGAGSTPTVTPAISATSTPLSIPERP